MSTATLEIGTERVGTRVYVTGNTYAVKDRLKAAGCHWDGERRQWWIGAAKQAAIAAIVGGLAGQPAPKEDLSTRRVYGKAKYKGRLYYVIGQSGSGRLRLTVLDGKIDFWADESACQWEKRYTPREYRGRTEYQTLGGIQRFVESRKQHDPDGIGQNLEPGYYMQNGEVLASGCAECRRLGTMCRSCQHDYE